MHAIIIFKPPACLRPAAQHTAQRYTRPSLTKRCHPERSEGSAFSSSRHGNWVPHPFAPFAKGWEDDTLSQEALHLRKKLSRGINGNFVHKLFKNERLRLGARLAYYFAQTAKIEIREEISRNARKKAGVFISRGTDPPVSH